MEVLFEILIHILGQSFGVGIVVAIDKFVVRRRDAIVRGVRRLQAILSIPPCLSLVSDTAPGITDETLRFGTEMNVYLGMVWHFLFLAVVVAGKVKSLWGLVTGLVVPACFIISVWFYFIRARWAFDRGERDEFEKGSGENPGLQRSIAGVLGVR